jgi:hypothetical protein
MRGETQRLGGCADGRRASTRSACRRARQTAGAREALVWRKPRRRCRRRPRRRSPGAEQDGWWWCGAGGDRMAGRTRRGGSARRGAASGAPAALRVRHASKAALGGRPDRGARDGAASSTPAGVQTRARDGDGAEVRARKSERRASHCSRARRLRRRRCLPRAPRLAGPRHFAQGRCADALICKARCRGRRSSAAAAPACCSRPLQHAASGTPEQRECAAAGTHSPAQRAARALPLPQPEAQRQHRDGVSAVGAAGDPEQGTAAAAGTRSWRQQSGAAAACRPRAAETRSMMSRALICGLPFAARHMHAPTSRTPADAGTESRS